MVMDEPREILYNDEGDDKVCGECCLDGGGRYYMFVGAVERGRGHQQGWREWVVDLRE